MPPISRRERDQGRSQGISDKLASWKLLRRNATSFFCADNRFAERGPIERPELEEGKAFDDRRPSSAAPATPYGQRAWLPRADQATESPLLSATAAFD